MIVKIKSYLLDLATTVILLLAQIDIMFDLYGLTAVEIRSFKVRIKMILGEGSSLIAVWVKRLQQ